MSTRTPGRPPVVAPEEIQLRCALALAQEALAGLSAGLAPSPGAADLAAVLEVGYPAFRGGPLRWIDDVGPAEVRRRLAWYERSLGPRFAPSPALLALAEEDRRIFAP